MSKFIINNIIKAADSLSKGMPDITPEAKICKIFSKILDDEIKFLEKNVPEVINVDEYKRFLKVTRKLFIQIGDNDSFYQQSLKRVMINIMQVMEKEGFNV